MMDSDSEEEVFCFAVSDKERRINRKLRSRPTEMFVSGFRDSMQGLTLVDQRGDPDIENDENQAIFSYRGEQANGIAAIMNTSLTIRSKSLPEIHPSTLTIQKLTSLGRDHSSSYIDKQALLPQAPQEEIIPSAEHEVLEKICDMSNSRTRPIKGTDTLTFHETEEEASMQMKDEPSFYDTSKSFKLHLSESVWQDSDESDTELEVSAIWEELKKKHAERPPSENSLIQDEQDSEKCGNFEDNDTTEITKQEVMYVKDTLDTSKHKQDGNASLSNLVCSPLKEVNKSLLTESLTEPDIEYFTNQLQVLNKFSSENKQVLNVSLCSEIDFNLTIVSPPPNTPANESSSSQLVSSQLKNAELNSTLGFEYNGSGQNELHPSEIFSSEENDTSQLNFSRDSLDSLEANESFISPLALNGTNITATMTPKDKSSKMPIYTQYEGSPGTFSNDPEVCMNASQPVMTTPEAPLSSVARSVEYESSPEADFFDFELDQDPSSISKPVTYTQASSQTPTVLSPLAAPISMEMKKKPVHNENQNAANKPEKHEHNRGKEFDEISNRAGIINLHNFEIKRPTMTKPKRFWSPRPNEQVVGIRTTKIPVKIGSSSTGKFKTTTMFDLPGQKLKWDVASPVGKYIKEQAPPLIAVVRPNRELSKIPREIPTPRRLPQDKSRLPTSREVPAAEYTVNREMGPNLPNYKQIDKMSKKVVTFLPTVVKHTGSSKELSGANYLPSEESIVQYGYSVKRHNEPLEMSVMEQVQLQKTNTLY